MIQTANGEVKFKKDHKALLIHGLALLLALALFLVMQRLGAVTKFARGSEATYEGVVSDRAYSTIDQNDRWAESREYICLSLLGSEPDGICIWAASDKAPDRSKYSFPANIQAGDHVIITAAKEVGTGLMVVKDVKIICHGT